MSKTYNFHTQFKQNAFETGESIEEKMRRVTSNGERIDESAPEIYTDRKDGVIPAYDIRADRFEIALEAMDKVNRSNLAQRDEFFKKLETQNNEPKEEPKETA